MKLSTKGRYGLRAMLDLAVHSYEGHVSLRSIAERQGISENYLEQIFATLKKAGIVNSLRGSQGGYALSMTPDKITVGIILRALEGSLAPVDCVLEDDYGECRKNEECITRLVWRRMWDCINKVVDSVTLQDLVNEYNKRNDMNGYIYYI
jgi:Rrf2 family cysteine metabolism transcriptional repressor